VLVEESYEGPDLLAPTTLYQDDVEELIARADVHGLAHVTGGGVLGNLSRVLPEGLQASIEWDAWERPPVFRWLACHCAEYAPRRGARGVACRAWRRACRPRRFHAAADRAVSRALPGPDPERAPVAAACIPGSASGRGRARARGQGHRGNRALRRRWGRYRPNRAAGGGCGSERRHRRNAARADPGGRTPAAARCGPTLPRRQAELAGGPRVIKRALISVYDK